MSEENVNKQGSMDPILPGQDQPKPESNMPASVEEAIPGKNSASVENTGEQIPPHDSFNDSGNIVQQSVKEIKTEVQKVIIGMDVAIEDTVAAAFTNGHVLFEGFPGLAKTLLVNLISRTLTVDFKRIQFTPDLMPSDVIGTMILDQQRGSFSFHKGPIFSNMVLIDEINRAPAKTQSALFEVMEERQITVEGITHKLDYPFLVIGTQNPIDQEGTYRLPEAQLDRFIFKIKVPYPTPEEELAILDRFKDDFEGTIAQEVLPVMDAQKIRQCENFIQGVHIEPQILKYITQITHATRDHESIYLGASPRASLALMKTSKAFAAMAGRNYVKPDDVQRACIPILNHRILLSASAEMEGYSSEDLIKSILEDIEVPR